MNFPIFKNKMEKESTEKSKSEESLVTFICVKEKSKLRIRIISPGYNKDANCQFPTKLREEGKKYTAPSSAVTFSKTNSKLFYRVNKNYITVLEKSEIKPETSEKSSLNVYGRDDEDQSCIICMDKRRFYIFIPCGHFCVCESCYISLKTTDMREGRSESNCPLCREKISNIASEKELDK